LTALDLVEGLQLGHAAAALHELGVLPETPMTAAALAKKHRLDSNLLRGVLDYLAARTDLVRKEGDRYVATDEYSRHSRFLLGLYGLAYGNHAAQLAKLLRKPSLAASLVDRAQHARALEGTNSAGALPAIIRQLGFTNLLDLGCGPATMLVALAESDPDFLGWGVEKNPAMRKAARANIRAAGVTERVRILPGDAFHLKLPNDVRKTIRTVSASQLANELFGHGQAAAITWLRSLRKQLPGRPLLLADYYGRLGTNLPAQRETLLHDYAQLLSGQGIPPPDAGAWQALYQKAGCRLVHVIEDNETTLFVHVVVLGKD
jgi:SAM-dependent methyltransferase